MALKNELSFGSIVMSAHNSCWLLAAEAQHESKHSAHCSQWHTVSADPVRCRISREIASSCMMLNHSDEIEHRLAPPACQNQLADMVQQREHSPVADECLCPLLHCPLIAHQLDERASFHLGVQLLSLQGSKWSKLDAKARTRVAGSMTQSRTCEPRRWSVVWYACT